MNTTTIDSHEYALLPLSRGKFAIVDMDLVERLNQWKWVVNGGGYATKTFKRGGRNWAILMHRFIAETPDGLLTDHINGNKLDNRRINLRHATDAENNRHRRIQRRNKLGIKGVSFEYNRFRAKIRSGNVKLNLGSFKTAEQAQAAYNAAAIRLHGEFAALSTVIPPPEP